MSAWYLLHCKARQEARARLNIENQGYVTCCPMIKVEKRIAGKRKIVAEPLFPNYLFIKLDENSANFNAIRSTRGVNKFVSFGGLPATVPDSVVEQFIRVEEAAELNPATGMYKAGNQVEITEGPFAGLTAVYQMRKGDDRCLVLLEMMGKQQHIEMEERQLRKR